MLSEAQLLNIKTIEQLLHLQGKIPDFLENQISTLRERWTLYIAEILAAVEQEQNSSAADLCHKIKGHAGMLGFHAIQLKAGDLETTFRNNQSVASEQIQHREALMQLDHLFHESLKSLDSWIRQNSGRSMNDDPKPTY